MNVRKLGIALSLVLSLALAWALSTLGAQGQGSPGGQDAFCYVSAEGGVDSGDCTNPAQPCATVQYAVDQAVPGAEICVATGTYTDVQGRPAPPGYFYPHSYPSPQDVITQVVCVTKTVAIRGGYTAAFTDSPDPDANPTTLDARGQGRVFCIVGDISPTIEGLRITGGNAYGLTGSGPWDWNTEDAGGGVYVLSATITLRQNLVFSNTSDFREDDYAKGYGGGVFLRESDGILSDNTITANSAAEGGGLVLNRGVVEASGNVITANVAVHGGGLYLNQSEARFTGNIFAANTAEGTGGGLGQTGGNAFLGGNVIAGNAAWFYGGGLSLDFCAATLNENVITANMADGWGGGLYIQDSEARLGGNIVVSNTAGTYGGGLYLLYCTPTLNSNVVASNQAITGSELCILASSPTLQHTTLANNSGGDGSGVYISEGTWWGGPHYSTVAMTNTILVSHTVGISVTGGNTVKVNGILWHDTPVTVSQAATAIVTVQNQSWGDPAFVDPAGGDYHIGPGSVALNAGVDAKVWTDVDGQPRPYQLPDLGADEYWPPGVLKYLYLLLAWRHGP